MARGGSGSQLLRARSGPKRAAAAHLAQAVHKLLKADLAVLVDVHAADEHFGLALVHGHAAASEPEQDLRRAQEPVVARVVPKNIRGIGSGGRG